MKKKLVIIFLLILNLRIKAQTNCRCSDPGSVHTNWGINDPAKIIGSVPNNFWHVKTDNLYPAYENQTTELVFEDNFEGSLLDINKWKFSQNYQANYVTFRNYNCFVDAGFLHTRAKVEVPSTQDRYMSYLQDNEIADDGNVNLRTFGWSKGEVLTNQLFKHGIFEIRAKTPQIHGVHPAMWLYDGIAEIDIMEMNQGRCKCVDEFTTVEPCDGNEGMSILEREDYSSGRVYQTIHYGNKSTSSTVFRCNEDYENSFHTYKLIWDEYKIAIYLDGANTLNFYHYYYQLYGSPSPVFNKADADFAISLNSPIQINPSFPIRATNLLIGLGMDNLAQYNSDNIQGPFSNYLYLNEEMLVDWVRIYAFKDCQDNLFFDEPANTHIKNWQCGTYIANDEIDDNSLPTFILGKNVTIAGGNSKHIINNIYRQHTDCWDVLSPAFESVNIRATDKITFKPGFSVMHGATLNAKTTTCANGFARYAFAPNSTLPPYNIVKDYSNDKIISSQQASTLFNEDDFRKQNPYSTILNNNKLSIRPNPAST